MDKKQLSELPGLKARKRELEGQLSKLAGMEDGQVSAETCEKLKTQYEKELTDIEQSSRELVQQGENKKSELEKTIGEIKKRVAEEDGKLKELEVLHQNGALGEDDFKKRGKDIRRAKSAAEKEQAKTEKQLAWVKQCLTSETPVQSGGVGEKGGAAAKKLVSMGIGFVKDQIDSAKGGKPNPNAPKGTNTVSPAKNSSASSPSPLSDFKTVLTSPFGQNSTKGKLVQIIAVVLVVTVSIFVFRFLYSSVNGGLNEEERRIDREVMERY